MNDLPARLSKLRRMTLYDSVIGYVLDFLQEYTSVYEHHDW